jgi:hypothetical protein
MPKTNNIYIAEDSNGYLRISTGKDTSLARASWHRTNDVTIYGHLASRWWSGSCRMSRQARRRFHRARLNKVCSRFLPTNSALALFAQAIADLEDTEAAKPSLPNGELCLGEWVDDNGRTQMLISCRSLFAKVFSARLDFPAGTYTNMLAVYSGGVLLGSYPLAKGSQGAMISQIINILDEVADGKRTGSRTSRSRASVKTNRRARR